MSRYTLPSDLTTTKLPNVPPVHRRQNYLEKASSSHIFAHWIQPLNVVAAENYHSKSQWVLSLCLFIVLARKQSHLKKFKHRQYYHKISLKCYLCAHMQCLYVCVCMKIYLQEYACVYASVFTTIYHFIHFVSPCCYLLSFTKSCWHFSFVVISFLYSSTS